MEKNTVNYELSRFSSYQSAIMVRYSTLALLVIALIYHSANRLDSTPLYLIVYYLILPLLLHGVFLKRTIEEEFLLGAFKNKIKYTSLKYKCEVYSYNILLILLIIWHIKGIRTGQAGMPEQYIPMCIIFITIGLRVLGIIYYRIKDNYVIKYNRYK